MNIKNLKKASNRLLQAVKRKERIILYGDADLDGVCSVIILQEAIEALSGNVSSVYFPDREKEGYGITKTGLKFLEKISPALLVALDCGIGNIKEIELAKKLGFSVIVIDHHKVLDKLPKAEVVVDPYQPGESYPFKDFATVGIAFKLSQLLLEKKMTKELEKSFLEITALATIADMMPKKEDNKIFIEKGTACLDDSRRPGIRLLFESDFLAEYDLSHKIQKMISILNVRDVENGAPTSFLILTSSSEQEILNLIQRIKEKNRDKKEMVKAVMKEAEKNIVSKKQKIIFEGSRDWPYLLISTIASLLCKDFKKPTFIYKKMEKESQGTVRVPSKIDSVIWMKRCKKHLLTFGGHAKASGFRIKNNNLIKFRKCLIANYPKT